MARRANEVVDPRISALLKAAERMRDGQFGFDLPAANTGDDIDALGRALQDLGRALQGKLTELHTLLTLTERINSGLLLDDVCNHIFESFRSIIPYNRIGVALLENDSRYLRARWARSDSTDVKIDRSYGAELEGSSLESVLRTGEPRIINDLVEYFRRHPNSKPTELIIEEGMRSSLTCPLIASGKPVGFMFFSSMKPHTYENVHIDLFVTLAGQISAVIEKSRLYEQLLELNELKNRFLGIAAHDLRSPLSVVRGYIKLLKSDALQHTPEASAQMLDRVDATCDGMITLINDLLDVSAIESGQLMLDMRPVDLGKYLRECHEMNRLHAQSKSIELRLELASGLPVVEMDPDRIGQAINNIVSNAIKFSQCGTVITLGARADGGRVEIFVTDQGPGIPESELGKIFTEFGRTSVRPTQGEKSTGLGLAIVKRMIEAHGGDIRVKSTVGIGSTFCLVLPIRQEPA